MLTWCRGAAVLTACLLLGTGARAQFSTQPTPYGAARTPEPAPIAPSSPLPALIPGPITPLDTPPGPPNSLSLPAGHTGAFQAEDFALEQAVYANIGFQGLKRQTPGGMPIAFTSPGVLDTGTRPLGRLPFSQSLDEIGPNMSFGVRGEAGYIYNNHIAEFAFFYVYTNSEARQIDNQGQVFVPFENVPVGFEGNNGLFLQADRVRTTFSSRIWNAEFNYRYSNVALTDCEIIMGIRYLDQNELLTIAVDDDGLSNVDLLGNPDPLRIGVSTTSAQNRIVAPQLGFEYHKGIFHWFSVGMNAKGAWGVNFVETKRMLERGDGLVGVEHKNSDAVFSHIYQMGFFCEFHLTERMRIRGGYDLLWLLQIATAEKQFTFDLAAPPGTGFNRDGSAFYHGPQAELMFLF